MDSTTLEAILDVAIGMIFMWLILSVATMSVQEWIASYLKWRAKDLESAIERLLSDKTWAEQLYNHPLIKGLSKKAGVKPSYIPANKFALALYDIVMTAGTQESYIQQRLLAANRELNKAPRQLIPFLGYVFKRFGRSLGKLFNRALYFLGRDKGIPEQKYDHVIQLTEILLQAKDAKKTKKLTESLKEFFRTVLSDKTPVDGKLLSIPSEEFLRAYPVFQEYFYELLGVVLEKQPHLKLRWSEILVYNDDKLVRRVEKDLTEGETLREKLREISESYAREFDLEIIELEDVILCVRQTLDEIDFSHLVVHIQSLIGNTTEGLEALQTLNPELYKSLQQLYGDIIGIANNSQMMRAVRTRFAIAAVNLEKGERNLAAMRLNIETWFNESMDRLSGWYKRKATLLAFLIGLVLAGILNVDSILLAQHLWREPAVRQALAANATEFTNENSTLPGVNPDSDDPAPPGDAIEFFEGQFEGLNLPLGWTFEAVLLQPGQVCQLIPLSEYAVWGLEERVDETAAVTGQLQCQKISNAPTDSAGWFLKIMGIILSAGAAAQGAPFWFDILKKLVNIRGTGAKPNEDESE